MVGRLRGEPGHLGPVQAGAPFRVGHAAPDLQRAFEVAQRLGGRVGGRGAGRGVDRGGQRAGQVEGGVPVAGQRAGQRRLVAGQAGVGGQRLGVGGVQVGPLAGQHVLIHRVPGQRVPELVAVSGRVDHQQVVLHGLPQRGEELGPGDPGDLGEQPVWHRPARDRRGAQQPLRVRAQRVHPAEQHVPQRWRQARRVAAGPHYPGELLDQVGVAAGPAEHHVRDARRGVRAEDRPKLGGDLFAAEPAQPDVADRPVALPGGQQRAQRVVTVQFVRPVGDHQQHAAGGQRPDQERGQVQGRPVGPVHVLDRKQDRPDRAQPAEHAEDELEKLCLLRGLAGRSRRLGFRSELGQQPGQGGRGRAEDPAELVRRHRAGERAQHVHQRGERQALGPRLDALPGQHAEPRVLRPRGQFPQQPGLADTRLAPEEHEPGLSGQRPVQRRGQDRQLLAAPDQYRTDHVPAHGQKAVTHAVP